MYFDTHITPDPLVDTWLVDGQNVRFVQTPDELRAALADNVPALTPLEVGHLVAAVLAGRDPLTPLLVRKKLDDPTFFIRTPDDVISTETTRLPEDPVLRAVGDVTWPVLLERMGLRPGTAPGTDAGDITEQPENSTTLSPDTAVPSPSTAAAPAAGIHPDPERRDDHERP